MKMKLLHTLLVAGVALAGIQTAQAQTNIKQLDSDTIRITVYSGKPPYKRLTITREDQPERFAYYADRINYDPRPLVSSTRNGGPPGKSVPGNALRVIDASSEEVAEFARFEETDGTKTVIKRSWRGAPGKMRAIRR